MTWIIISGFIKDTSGVYDAAFYTATGASVFISAATVVMVIIERRRTYRNKTDIIKSDIYYKPIKWGKVVFKEFKDAVNELENPLRKT